MMQEGGSGFTVGGWRVKQRSKEGGNKLQGKEKETGRRLKSRWYRKKQGHREDEENGRRATVLNHQ